MDCGGAIIRQVKANQKAYSHFLEVHDTNFVVQMPCNFNLLVVLERFRMQLLGDDERSDGDDIIRRVIRHQDQVQDFASNDLVGVTNLDKLHKGLGLAKVSHCCLFNLLGLMREARCLVYHNIVRQFSLLDHSRKDLVNRFIAYMGRKDVSIRGEADRGSEKKQKDGKDLWEEDCQDAQNNQQDLSYDLDKEHEDSDRGCVTSNDSEDILPSQQIDSLQKRHLELHCLAMMFAMDAINSMLDPPSVTSVWQQLLAEVIFLILYLFSFFFPFVLFMKSF